MFQLMLQKLLHKKWMVFCMMLGNVLLIAAASGFPMYKVSSLNNMLQTEIKEYSVLDNKANIYSVSVSCNKGQNEAVYRSVLEQKEAIGKQFGIRVPAIIEQNTTTFSKAVSTIQRDDISEKKYRMSSLSKLAEGSKVLSGKICEGRSENGAIEAMVTSGGMVKMDLIMGEELEFSYFNDVNGESLRLVIVGVIDAIEGADCWVTDITSFDEMIIISEQSFAEVFLGEAHSNYYIRSSWYYWLDTAQVTVSNLGDFIDSVDAFTSTGSTELILAEPGMMDTLRNFHLKEFKISTTLMILQVPLLGLLLTFLFMISGQMLAMEQNEISLLKSRGASKWQIVNLYFLQSVFLSLTALVLGFPLGTLICRMLGASVAFLQFDFNNLLPISINAEVFIYAGVAALLSVIFTVIPAFSQAGISIVHVKRKKARSSKKLWQKMYLDVIFLAISFYGFYSFRRQSDSLGEEIITGESLDPLLYISSILFILGAGLLFVRLWPYVAKLIFAISKKILRPAGYAALLQVIRTGSERHLVMLFLIFTVSLGVFNSAVARTILSNAERGETYMTGANLVFNESWPNNLLEHSVDPSVPLVYREPDFERFYDIPGLESAARVYVNDSVVYTEGTSSVGAKLMAVSTKEYGETIQFDSTLLNQHINYYLNELAKTPRGVLCSRGFETLFNKSVGQTINVKNSDGERLVLTIVGFVDYWPTYETTVSFFDKRGNIHQQDAMFMIVNYEHMSNMWKVTPYRVYLKFADNNTDGFYKWVNDNDIKIATYKDLNKQKAAILDDTMFSGTISILSLSFIIVIIICMTGYLIYWIMSIKSRELLFGVLRAMGLKKSEIVNMIIVEQIFSGVAPVLIGVVIGVAASFMYVPMIMLSYAAGTSFIPLVVTTDTRDVIKLGVIIAFMVLVGIIVLARLISKMKITNALKLGEE